MVYRVGGLAAEAFAPLFDMSEAELAARRARRTVAEGSGYPCRISLEEAAPGEALILVNHVSQEAATPFRAAHAIYVRKDVARGSFTDAVPAILATRTLGLRAFDREGMLRGALLAPPGEADARIRELFERPEVAEIHAHNAALGCFLARIERN
ncbi:MAG TPA: DUF1203 domain-containing protein [Allosphingosinicella sp.]|jgi:hypothetical protein|nr:DUF1203 domain-containing protein [Allosphingosinicella sp.]